MEVGSKRKRKDTEATNSKKTSKVNATVEPPVIPYKVGQYVAMCCYKYKEYKPQIAKVKKINASTRIVQIDWLDGDYDSSWAVWKVGGRIIKDSVPIRAILAHVDLSSDMRISKKLKCELDKKYSSAEFV